MLLQPCPDLGVIVRAVVVQNHMDGQVFGGFTVDLSQKFFGIRCSDAVDNKSR